MVLRELDIAREALQQAKGGAAQPPCNQHEHEKLRILLRGEGEFECHGLLKSAAATASYPVAIISSVPNPDAARFPAYA